MQKLRGSVVLLGLLAFIDCTHSTQPASRVPAGGEASGRPIGVATPTTGRRSGPFDQRVDAGGGRRLHIQCDGAGTPLVVLESGLGQGVEAWSHVWRPVTSFTRACVYDRANHGTSDRAPVPHSNRQMAQELFVLLSNSDEAAPYVLVGHSMGGTNVQLFLEEHPDTVAGMVLIDASPEPPPFDQIPPAAMAEFEANIVRLEGLNVDTMLAGFRELRASKRTLGHKPLAVLVAGKTPDDPNFDAAQREQFLVARQQAQQPLLGLSSDNRLVMAKESAHHIPNEAPKLVIDTIEAVVTAVRTGRPYADSTNNRR